MRIPFFSSTEAASVSSSEAVFPAGAQTDPDEHLWEPFTIRGGMRRTVRNLPAVAQRQMLDYSHYFYKGNPLAKRMIDIVAEYVIGTGIGYVAEDLQVRRILDAHWSNLTNRWSILQFDRTRDLGIGGELCMTTHTNPMNGHVTLGHIDPSMIEYVIDHRDNQMRAAAIILRKIKGETERRAYKIIDVSEATEGDAVGRLVGLPETAEEKVKFGFDFMVGDTIIPTNFVMNTNIKAVWKGSVFFFTVNNPLSANRGWSDLLPTLDWIDAHDQFLFSQVEKAIESAKYIWDVTMTGMDEKRLREYAAKQNKFKPGERNYHNQNVEYKVMSPDLHLEDAASLASSLKNHVLAGTGLPPIWFAESLTSRASAPEMTEPAYKHIKVRQRYVAYMLSTIFRFVIDQAVLKGRLTPDKRLSPNRRADMDSAAFYMKMPDISAKDHRALASAINNISQAIERAVGTGYMDEETAKRIFQRHLDQSGFDTWKDEPVLKRGHDLLPNQDDTSSSLFQRVTEGSAEFSTGGYTYYLSPDPNLTHGTLALESLVEKARQDARVTQNGRKDVRV